ncbi:hypothetical protein AX774_g1781 [Zancudomyces culisetae]|uniref:Uncharacterized protein n=1 Tax=Zancudomyces culisetae TaxID=1213189 RepID=A0A1R1PUT6_ZANCU|nr:hypothetical protein AX774_g1781 [Zancudomyces culisetae]|eukprot:OMH84683.1 hypothetical protein AX774_g1781 [Zancudomyces culisetae]
MAKVAKSKTKTPKPSELEPVGKSPQKIAQDQQDNPKAHAKTRLDKVVSKEKRKSKIRRKKQLQELLKQKQTEILKARAKSIIEGTTRLFSWVLTSYGRVKVIGDREERDAYISYPWNKIINRNSVDLTDNMGGTKYGEDLDASDAVLDESEQEALEETMQEFKLGVTTENKETPGIEKENSKETNVEPENINEKEEQHEDLAKEAMGDKKEDECLGVDTNDNVGVDSSMETESQSEQENTQKKEKDHSKGSYLSELFMRIYRGRKEEACNVEDKEVEEIEQKETEQDGNSEQELAQEAQEAQEVLEERHEMVIQPTEEETLEPIEQSIDETEEISKELVDDLVGGLVQEIIEETMEDLEETESSENIILAAEDAERYIVAGEQEYSEEEQGEDEQLEQEKMEEDEQQEWGKEEEEGNEYIEEIEEDKFERKEGLEFSVERRESGFKIKLKSEPILQLQGVKSEILEPELNLWPTVDLYTLDEGVHKRQSPESEKKETPIKRTKRSGEGSAKKEKLMQLRPYYGLGSTGNPLEAGSLYGKIKTPKNNRRASKPSKTYLEGESEEGELDFDEVHRKKVVANRRKKIGQETAQAIMNIVDQVPTEKETTKNVFHSTNLPSFLKDDIADQEAKPDEPLGLSVQSERKHKRGYGLDYSDDQQLLSPTSAELLLINAPDSIKSRFKKSLSSGESGFQLSPIVFPKSPFVSLPTHSKLSSSSYFKSLKTKLIPKKNTTTLLPKKANKEIETLPPQESVGVTGSGVNQEENVDSLIDSILKKTKPNLLPTFNFSLNNQQSDRMASRSTRPSGLIQPTSRQNFVFNQDVVQKQTNVLKLNMKSLVDENTFRDICDSVLDKDEKNGVTVPNYSFTC